MEDPYHSGMPDDVASKDAARVKALIDELDRRARMIEGDIAREEELAGVSGPFDAAYPVLARMMTAQRDNLKQTIGTLQQRLAANQARSA